LLSGFSNLATVPSGRFSNASFVGANTVNGSFDESVSTNPAAFTAANAGVKGGDIIIGLAREVLEDIYSYMGMLNKLKKGQLTTITVLRDDIEMTMDLLL
jgi:S1-C subfamily serine protease